MKPNPGSAVAVHAARAAAERDAAHLSHCLRQPLRVRLSGLPGAPEVLFVPDGFRVSDPQRQRHDGRVVYRARELARLLAQSRAGHLDPATLALIHAAKADVGGVFGED